MYFILPFSVDIFMQNAISRRDPKKQQRKTCYNKQRQTAPPFRSMSLSDRSTCSSLVTAGTFPFRSQTEGVRSGANRPLYPCNAQRLADAAQQNTGSGTRLTNSTKRAFGLRSRTTACAGESPRLTHVYLPHPQQQTKHSGEIQTWRDAEQAPTTPGGMVIMGGAKKEVDSLHTLRALFKAQSQRRRYSRLQGHHPCASNVVRSTSDTDKPLQTRVEEEVRAFRGGEMEYQLHK